jgi:hypothetical protein
VGQICSFQCNYLTVFFVFTLCQFRLYFGIRIVVCKCAELALRRGCVSCNVNQETRQSPYMGTVLAKFFLPFSPLPDYLLVIWEIWNFNRQFRRWVSRDTNDMMTRLPPYARTQMCHPACVSQLCRGSRQSFGQHRRVCVGGDA